MTYNFYSQHSFHDFLSRFFNVTLNCSPVSHDYVGGLQSDADEVTEKVMKAPSNYEMFLNFNMNVRV